MRPSRSTATLLLSATFAAALLLAGEPFAKWPLSKAIEVLNVSPWARQETFTRVIGGVGSGISGEKEIYNTFYVRLLSARPIREAFTRITQIRAGYDRLDLHEKDRFDISTRRLLEIDFKRWVVISVGFRSNDPNEESSVRRFFQSQTIDTLKNRAFLSTDDFPQVEMAAYFVPRDEIVGAKFVFPRQVGAAPLVTKATDSLTFELMEVPGAHPHLRAMFSVKAMALSDELVF
jgi:hypothetical protein